MQVVPQALTPSLFLLTAGLARHRSRHNAAAQQLGITPIQRSALRQARPCMRASICQMVPVRETSQKRKQAVLQSLLTLDSRRLHLPLPATESSSAKGERARAAARVQVGARGRDHGAGD